MLFTSSAWGAAPPVVMMLRTGTTPESRQHESKLYDELGLALDGFMLESQVAEDAGFAGLPFAEQLASALPLARREGAMAVVWLSFPVANQMMLHLVAIGSGRALIRTIETDRSRASEMNLALVCRELLGTAYLFEPPSSIPAEMREVVSAVKKQIPVEKAPEPEPAPPPPPAPEPRWGLWLDIASSVPLAGAQFPSPMAGGGLSLERVLPSRFSASLRVAARYAEAQRTDAQGSRLWLPDATLELAREGAVGVVAFAPFVSATLGLAVLVAPDQTTTAWLPRFALGLAVRSQRTFGLRVGARLALAYCPVQAELDLGSQVLYRTPALELALALELGWGL
jgi:hypothetical protein